MKMKNIKRLLNLAALLPAGLVLALTAAFFLSEKQTFSENENRYLAKLPSLCWEKVKSGSYTEELNSYLTDHFPFRDLFVGFKTKAETALGRQEINGVYLTRDGSLIEEYKKPENTERIARTFRRFAEELKGEEVDVRLMLVPTAAAVYADKLPAYAPRREQLETAGQLYEAAGISAVDCSRALQKHREEGELYYKTDHHWTTFGAYEGYRVFCQEMRLTPVLLEELTPQTVTGEFCGTLVSRTGAYDHEGDAITVYTNPADRLTVIYEDTGEITDSLYNLEYVQKKDKYALFLNHLHPLVEIVNETAESDRELVLIKDSYANSMVPFLAHHYKKIYVFDTRYYKEGPSSFIKEHSSVTDVLLLYNLNTLDTDTGIRGVY